MWREDLFNFRSICTHNDIIILLILFYFFALVLLAFSTRFSVSNAFHSFFDHLSEFSRCDRNEHIDTKHHHAASREQRNGRE